MYKNWIGGVSDGRAGQEPRSPFPSRARSVNPAAVHGRRSNLPREICFVSRIRDWGWRESPWPRSRSQQRA